MRLIDADVLMEQPVWLCGGWLGDSYAEGYMDALDKIEETVKSAPTINAVPIVLCKDCKHYDFTDNRVPQERVWWCYYWGCEIGANDFCSYAERKYNG